jgi:hypothetical protein
VPSALHFELQVGAEETDEERAVVEAILTQLPVNSSFKEETKMLELRLELQDLRAWSQEEWENEGSK